MKYRMPVTDKYDIQYAEYVKKLFDDLPADFQAEFNTFTDDMMKEEAISRGCLLMAITDFGERRFPKVVGGNDFVNGAYNYRPYQSM